MAVARLSALDTILAKANKGGSRIGGMDDVANDVMFISTGNIAIDSVLGGGLPLGRSIELFGLPSCGKTTTALQAAVELQKIIKAGGDPERGIKPDDRIVYMDYEQAMDKRYAVALGLDIKHESLLFTQPDTLEEGANLAIDLVKTGRVRMIIFDSVAAMNPSAKAEAEIGKSLPAVQAKLMKDFGVTFNSVLYNNNAICIYLNHQMEKMDMGGARRPGMPPATTTPGGVALKYFASVRVRYTPTKKQKGKILDPITNMEVEVPVSTDVKIFVEKNKVAPPFRSADVRVRFGKGFDNYWAAMQILLANKKVMHQSPNYFFHNVEEIGLAPDWMKRHATGTKRPYINGEGKLMKAGDQHPEWRKQIIELAELVAEENHANLELEQQIIVSPEDDDDDDDLEAEAENLFPSLSAGNRVEV
jgi:recombination protein RecA